MTNWCTRIIIAMCCCCGGCIEEINIFNAEESTLIIDGSITNEEGPHKVKVSKTHSFNTVVDYRFLDNAMVSITDDMGNREVLTYQGSGEFFTRDDFRALQGRSYTLTVQLAEDIQYKSSAEVLPKVSEMTGLKYKKAGTKISFFIDFNDQKDEANFYRWRYKSIYQVRAPIAYEMSRTNQPLKNSHCISWSGAPPLAKDVINCWVREYDYDFLKLENDILFNGKNMNDFLLWETDLDRRFNGGFLYEVRQLTLTENAFKYWNAINAQKLNNGTIFDTNNYYIKGNISSLKDPEEKVLGFFSVDAASSLSVFVYDFVGTFGDIPCEANNSGCYPERCMDCRRFAADATTTKPQNWSN